MTAEGRRVEQRQRTRRRLRERKERTWIDCVLYAQREVCWWRRANAAVWSTTAALLHSASHGLCDRQEATIDAGCRLYHEDDEEQGTRRGTQKTKKRT
jgi:hypothetical protein